MNLIDTIQCEEYLVNGCNCSMGVGSDVTADGFRGRGVIVRMNGRRVVIQFRSGLRIDRDRSFVHPLQNDAIKDS